MTLLDAPSTDTEFARIVSELTRRGFLGGMAGLAGSAGLLGLAACSSSTPDGGSGTTAGYPVRIPGKFGDTVVPTPPKRIVALGQGPDADAAVALGVAPVAVTRDPTAAGGIQPWLEQRLTGQPPTLLDTNDGPPLEQIAALRPDLIVATTYYPLAQFHDKLAGIAPVLAYANGPNVDRWQDNMTRLGKALGRAEAAATAVAGVQRTIIDDRAAHSAFKGKTFTFGPVQPDGKIYTTSTASDLSAALLAGLGLTLSPRVTTLPPSSTKGKSIISPEQLDLLDADVLILTYITPEQQKKLEASALFKRLPAVRRGAYVVLPLPVAVAMAFPSVLSVPYALQQTIPLLDKAIGA
jgi:iron complex transport system substrate-binding protein